MRKVTCRELSRRGRAGSSRIQAVEEEKSCQNHVVFQSPSCVRLCDPAHCSTLVLSLIISRSLSKFVSTELVMPSVQTSHPLSPSSSAFNISNHEGLFSPQHWVRIIVLWKMPTMDKMFGKVYSKQRQEKRQLIIFEVFQIVNNVHFIYSFKKYLLEVINSESEIRHYLNLFT